MVVACRQPVVEGLVVETETEKAHAVRRECLEFLLKNHPLDCPICDKAGECDLQDFAYAEGQGEGRSVEPRRKLNKRKSLGDVILLDEERCILCSRCVRFMEEVPETPQLTVAGLGSRSVIATFADRPLSGNYQGNLADICPVGALTLKKFRFQARVWNLRKSPSTCAECSRGCSTNVDVLRGREVKRIRPRYNPDVNRWWMCDTGRFAFDRFQPEGRLVGALVRGSHGLEQAPVEEALDRASDALLGHPEPLLVLSPFATQEEARALLTLAGAAAARVRFVSPPPNDLADEVLHTGDPCPNRRGLTELGIEGRRTEELLEELASCEAALLCGERVLELLGLVTAEPPGTAEAAAELPSGLRLFVADVHALDAPAVKACFGVPYSVEKTGTWVNVDGHRGALSAARGTPTGVTPLERLASELHSRLAAPGEPEEIGEVHAQ